MGQDQQDGSALARLVQGERGDRAGVAWVDDRSPYREGVWNTLAVPQVPRKNAGGPARMLTEPEQGCQHTGASKRTKTGHRETRQPDQLSRQPPRGQEVPSETVPQLQAQSVGSGSFPEPTVG